MLLLGNPSLQLSVCRDFQGLHVKVHITLSTMCSHSYGQLWPGFLLIRHPVPVNCEHCVTIADLGGFIVTFIWKWRTFVVDIISHMLNNKKHVYFHWTVPLIFVWFLYHQWKIVNLHICRAELECWKTGFMLFCSPCHKNNELSGENPYKCSDCFVLKIFLYVFSVENYRPSRLCVNMWPLCIHGALPFILTSRVQQNILFLMNAWMAAWEDCWI